MANMVFDPDGFPLLLANVPDANVSTAAKGQASGNVAHDKNSGKFQEKNTLVQGKEAGDKNVPANTDPLSYMRQMDAVRDMAREFDELAEGDIEEFLSGRVTRPLEPDEIQAFLGLVRQQRIDDFVDATDYQFRNLIANKIRGRRQVKVTAPRGWMKKTLNGLTDDEVVGIIHRLMARGHKPDDLKRSFLNKVRTTRRDSLGVKLSDMDESNLNLSLAEPPTFETYDENSNLEEFAEILSQWQPKIEVTVPVTVENKPTKRVVTRDPNTKLIQSIEEVEDGS